MIYLYRIRPDLIRDYDDNYNIIVFCTKKHRIRPDLIRDYDIVSNVSYCLFRLNRIRPDLIRDYDKSSKMPKGLLFKYSIE